MEILKALFRNIKLLILDEPTVVLTPLKDWGNLKTLRIIIAMV